MCKEISLDELLGADDIPHADIIRTDHVILRMKFLYRLLSAEQQALPAYIRGRNSKHCLCHDTGRIFIDFTLQ